MGKLVRIFLVISVLIIFANYFMLIINPKDIEKFTNYNKNAEYENIEYNNYTMNIINNKIHIIKKEQISTDSNILWRYSLEKAIIHALSNEELEKIKSLADNLKGNTIQESVWNILEWENKNIKYDYKKASLPNPEFIIYSNGSIKFIKGKENIIQTPYETITLKKGICGDYAILTAGLLLSMGYSPVYIFSIKFKNNDSGHVVAAININGGFFILDQHPPVYDLGSYYKYMKTKENKIIANATIYEIELNNGSATITKKGIVKGSDFLLQDYTFTDKDRKIITKDLLLMIIHNFNLKPDSSLPEFPKSYRYFKKWVITYDYFPEYYNPIFHKEFVTYLYKGIISDKKILEDLKDYSAIWVDSKIKNDNLEVIIYLAK